MTPCSLKLVALVVFGDKSASLIGRALARLKIDYIVVLHNEIPSFTPTHIILSGGPGHVYETNHYYMPKWVVDSDIPVLGICYGMQLIAHTFGGTVVKMDNKETGPVDVTEIINNHQITNVRWMNRFDQVICLPTMFTVTGVTNKNHIAAFTDYKKWWAIQYHPESVRHGDLIAIRQFINSDKNCHPL